MKSEIIKRDSGFRIPRTQIENFLSLLKKDLLKRKILKKSDLKKSLRLVFVDAKEMKSLNFQFRGVNKATDVLSFEPYEEDHWGELILCGEVLKKNALRFNWTIQAEALLMCLHGFLHLLGFDHENSRSEAMKMYNLQSELFESATGISFPVDASLLKF